MSSELISANMGELKLVSTGRLWSVGEPLNCMHHFLYMGISLSKKSVIFVSLKLEVVKF